MELDSRRHEHLRRLEVKRKRGVDHVGAHFPDQECELVARGVQVIGENVVVDGEQGLLAGEADRIGGKVALESGIDKR